MFFWGGGWRSAEKKKENGGNSGFLPASLSLPLPDLQYAGFTTSILSYCMQGTNNGSGHRHYNGGRAHGATPETWATIVLFTVGRAELALDEKLVALKAGWKHGDVLTPSSQPPPPPPPPPPEAVPEPAPEPPAPATASRPHSGFTHNQLGHSARISAQSIYSTGSLIEPPSRAAGGRLCCAAHIGSVRRHISSFMQSAQ